MKAGHRTFMTARNKQIYNDNGAAYDGTHIGAGGGRLPRTDRLHPQKDRRGRGGRPDGYQDRVPQAGGHTGRDPERNRCTQAGQDRRGAQDDRVGLKLRNMLIQW